MKIYKLSDEDALDNTARQPSPIEEENHQWFYQNIKYGLSTYNRPLFVNGRLAYIRDDNGATMQDQNKAGADSDYTLPIQDMITNMLYYFGRQPNLNYAYLTQNVTKNNIQAAWIKGQKVSRLVDHLTNSINTMLSNGKWEADNISPRAKGEKSDMLKQLLMMHDMKPFFNDLANQGVQGGMANGQQFEFPEEIYRYMETDYKEQGAEIMTMLADGLWEKSGWSSKAYQAARYMVCTNIACSEHTVVNGISQWEVFSPHQLIWDMRIDDDYNRYGMFRGRIRASTAAEIIRKYGFAGADKDELITMTEDNSLGTPLNTMPNITWWNYNQTYNSVTEVTMYWRAINSDGLLDVFKGTLIGGKWLVDIGKINNVVEDNSNCGMVDMPISIFCPNMMLSQYRSAVGRLRDLQNEVDALKFKVRETIGRAKGRPHIIRGNRMTGNIDVQEVFEDLSEVGLHVVNSSGEAGNPNEKDRLVEPIDMTLDANVQKIYDIARMEMDEMEEIVAASKTALGQQQRYIGGAAMQQNMAQSSMGMAYLIDGYMDWIQRNMQYAVDAQKEIIAAGKCKIDEFWIGSRNVVYLKQIKNVRFESFLLALDINNPMTEADKKEMTAMVQAAIQNQQLTFKDYAVIKNLKTKTEIIDYLEYTETKRERVAEKMRKEQMAMQEAQQNKQLLAQAAMEEGKIKGKAQLQKEKQMGEAELMGVEHGLNPPSEEGSV